MISSTAQFVYEHRKRSNTQDPSCLLTPSWDWLIHTCKALISRVTAVVTWPHGKEATSPRFTKPCNHEQYKWQGRMEMKVSSRGVKLIFTRGRISLMVAFKWLK